ncbi:phosphoglucosamine mutase [Desulfuribacillus stibiiarsenatis]|uniref:Phosphoglucosamine mutase n=1 Tax=Desulfuribacillus stibiiarsenatis TaxID=1390249 RepID=A0A1E5L4H0_9FIRM|nr:phosphoglucosamine mutase [Desulfuribacillus stibiiarsenatis]OEH84859.1 phosphoglucosamine mutase [Desulfuribacillus stibiiarsenatis]
MGVFFGTDGIRGVANQELTPELAFRLGKAAGHVLCKEAKGCSIIIGKDSRLSSDMLENALASGLMSVGVNILKLGLVPTPAVSFLVQHYQALAGAMISASHNPYPDNGIKLFNHLGLKLSEALEESIEQYLIDDALYQQIPRQTHDKIGKCRYIHDGVDIYANHLKSTVSSSFAGMKIVLDCANGSASELAPKIFAALGAEIICLFNQPTGININADCGSTHIQELKNSVFEVQADIGFAFDGDADRLIAVDSLGNIVDGDYILAICGKDMKERGKLVDNTVVTTVMANMGLFVAVEELQIRTDQTKVGDKYVLEAMIQHGYTLGGEQSGHIIFLEYGKTGDGILTALQIADLVVRKKKPLHELCQVMRKYPQLLVNIRVNDKDALHTNPAIKEAIVKNEQKLGNSGRVLVRPSGTEPLVRVMAEGPDEEQLLLIVNEIVDVIKKELV